MVANTGIVENIEKHPPPETIVTVGAEKLKSDIGKYSNIS
jgi:hypothetical protein